jgi:hypothetical protein
MIWATAFAGVSALCAYDAYQSLRIGKFTYVPRYYGKKVTYSRTGEPTAFWLGIGSEIVVALALAVAAISRISN